MRAELVVDALQMALWRRRPPAGQTVHHSDHGSQGNTPAGRSDGGCAPPACSAQWARSATDTYDNAMAESFFSVLQRELLDEQRWTSRHQLTLAVFEWIEAWYNPHRRHTSIGSLSPIAFEAARAAERLEEAA
jgi:putative transposase